MISRSFVILMAWGFLFFAHALQASPVPVRFKEGLTHGFLVLSTLDGKPIASGDLMQVAHGNQVTSRLVYHFKDGSLQDETTIFSQRRNFRLISYHLIQKGPAFPHPTEMSVNASSGEVTVRYTDDKGEEKVENEHLKLPPDVANGLILTLLKNVGPDTLPFQVAMVVATPKPRLVKLTINLRGTDAFFLAGSKREALHYGIKIEIGGVAGLLAPLLGKQPPDAQVWIMQSEVPTFIKSETMSYLGGPIWRTELTSPVWPEAAEADSADSKEKK